MISHTYQEKQERGRGRKAHLTDMLRDVWTRTGLAQNHTSLLGAVEVKAVLQLKAYQSLVCICSTELLRNKRWELKDDSNRLSTGREEQRWQEGRAWKTAQILHLGKAKTYKMPLCHMHGTILISPPLNNQCHIADILHIPTYIRLSQNIIYFSGVVTAMLQPMKQTAAEGRKQWFFSCATSHATLSKENNNSQNHSVEQDDEN